MGAPSESKGCGVKSASPIDPALIKAQKRVLEEIRKAWFFQYVFVEFYDNGLIKTIERDISWKAVVTLGAVVVIAGIAIYFVGPANIVLAIKDMIQLAPSLPKLAFLPA